MRNVDFGHLRFLIVDDNAYMRRVIRTLLHGFRARDVFEAEDGGEALELFALRAPDIILLDFEMPVLNGIDVVKMIRRPGASANAYVPIIMVTAHADAQLVAAARDAGVTEFLAKPFSAKGLYQRVHNAVAHPRPFIRTATYFGPDRRRGVTNDYDGPERRGAVEQEEPPTSASRLSDAA
jgi:two-component system chemotaxis response regulator CheY